MNVQPIPKQVTYRSRESIDAYRLEHPWCERCGGRYNLHVHHKKHRSQGGGDEHSNLEILCWICHDRAHGIYRR